MEAFTTLTSLAAPLWNQRTDATHNQPPALRDNVDTDLIIPKQFLKVLQRKGLGNGLFYDLRHDDKGNPVKGFVLDEPCYKGARILLAGDNFGSGSSREHAVWSLDDAGFRCVIASSFADIFYNNCFKNGVLPITLSPEQVTDLAGFAAHTQEPITVDLPQQTVTRADGVTYDFTIEPFRKKCLLEALDDIALTSAHEAAITAFEKTNRTELPWLWS